MSVDPLERRLHLLVPDRVPGLAVIVVGPESVRARVGVGFADIANGTDASPQRGRPWFSMTKIVTATVAVPLAERKAWKLRSRGRCLLLTFAILTWRRSSRLT